MERERIMNSLPPPQNPVVACRRVALLQGKSFADNTLHEIAIASKFAGVENAGSLLIRNYNVQVPIPMMFDSQEWGEFLGLYFNPLSAMDRSSPNPEQELALKHARHIILIEQGLTPKKRLSPGQTEQISTFKISWQTHYDKDGEFLYSYARIKDGDKPVFLALIPKGTDGKSILVEENMVISPDEKSFHDYWERRILGANETEKTPVAA